MPTARKAATATKAPAKAPVKRAARAPVTQPKAPSITPFETPDAALPVPVITAAEAVEMNTRPKETPSMSETPEKRTRQADPLLTAKRALEAARKAEAKAQKRVDAHGDIIAALEVAKAATVAALAAFNEAVAAV